MNCTIFQRRLLTLESPRRLPPELQGHLALCPSCRAWQRRLVEVEQAVPLLPVPASAAKDAFLRRVLSGEAVPRQEPAARRPPPRVGGPHRDRGLRKVALVTALAAGLLMYFGLVAVVAVHQGGPASGRPAAQDPLLAGLLNHDLHLAQASAKSERFHELAGLAEDLRGQAEPLARANAADDLQALAGWYGSVVRDGIIARRGDASAEDLAAVARQFEEARVKAGQLAGEVPEGCAAPLREIAAVAEKAGRSLQPGARSSRPRHELPPLALVGGRGPLPACIPAVALASITQEQPAATQPTPAEQVKRFQQNRDLIEELVTGGLRLAGEEDPVKRAACCNDIARSMADEMHLAAREHQGGRIAELGRHLRSLLQEGVAHNLGTARRRIPSGSAEEAALGDVRKNTEEVVEPLLRVIVDAADPDDVRAADSSIREGLESVKKAVELKR